MLVIKLKFNARKAIYNLGRAYKLRQEKKEIRKKPLIIHKHRILEKEEKEVFEPSKRKEIEVKKTGISIKDIGSFKKLYKKESVPLEEEKELTGLNIKYPLTPPYPSKGEKVYSWCNIKWDSPSNSLIYYVIEPSITPIEKKEMEKIKEIIEDKIDVRFELLKSGKASNYLKQTIGEIINTFGIKLNPQRKAIYEYYILRDFIGLGKIQSILNDPNLEDISCDGIKIPIYVYHRNPLYGSIRTNIMFETNEEVDSFLMKLSQRCGKNVSVAEPLFQGALPDGSRVQGTLATDIARRGSNFTIRKFTKDPLTPIHMLEFGTLDAKTLAYLWMLIDNNQSILISGPTASGKTSLLNVLSLFIRPSLKIISIEDTPELRLPHAHWVPEVARESIRSTGKGLISGQVDLFDLLKSSLRQRPDFIIVGEVRGKEAYVLFQQMATGHPGLSTIHADSMDKVIDRLTTPPINLPASLLETLDLILFIKKLKYKGSYVRKVSDIKEILGYDTKEKRLIINDVFGWDASTDNFVVKNDSILFNKIKESRGMNEDELKKELKNRIKVLNWMKEKKISHFKNVGKVISAYYSNPQRVIEYIEGE